MKSKIYIIGALIMLFLFSQTAIADSHHKKFKHYENGYSHYYNKSAKKHYIKHHKKNGKHKYKQRKNWHKGHGNYAVDDLVYAGITAILAGQYAREANLHGYHNFPPGIRKNLARGKPLPPGIAKKMVPHKLLKRLPRHPGYEWRISGKDLILLSVTSLIVADVLYDVFE